MKVLMIMKIICNRRDELLEERDAYNDAQLRHDSSYRAYMRYVHTVELSLAEYVEHMLGDLDLLNFDVNVSLAKFRSDDTVPNYRIRIACNERELFEENSALSWTYSAEISEMYPTPHVETSSWSGLRATTAEQLDSLKQTVDALEILRNMNWEQIFSDIDLDAYSDRVDPLPAARNFDSELAQIDIDEAVGTNTWFKVGHTYYHVLEATTKQFTVSVCNTHGSDLSDQDRAFADANARRMSKDKVYQLIGTNYETYKF